MSKPKEAPVLHLGDKEERATTARALRQSIRSGRFTAFLGAGASTISPESPEAAEVWGNVRGRLIWLRREVPKDAGPYVDGLAKGHELVLSGGIQAHSKIGQPGRLGELQVSLVAIGATLVELFGRKMGDGKRAVVDRTAIEVKIDPGDWPALLSQSCQLLDVARDLGECDDCRLNADGIYRCLQAFVYRLIGRRTWETLAGEQVSKANEYLAELVQTADKDDAPGKSLSLEQLEWVADLLWHTLSYDVATYPSASDLAFRMALGDGTASPFQRRPLAEASALRPTDELAEEIRLWLTETEEKAGVRPFHQVLAGTLHHLFELHRKRPANTPVPLAFTTNYDRTLELALRAIRSPYHLLCPAYVTETEQPCWIGRTVHPSDDMNARYEWDIVGGSSHLDSDANKDTVYLKVGPSILKDLAGPIVVKLHGSPMDNLDGTPFSHSLVLSEYSYLETIAGHSSPPPWIGQQLKGERDLWFFGYSLADWNIRASLYREATDNPKTWRADPIRGTVNRHVTASQKALLGPMDFVVYLGDLDKITSVIQTILKEMGHQQ
jgi:SIR2-like domain